MVRKIRAQARRAGRAHVAALAASGAIIGIVLGATRPADGLVAQDAAPTFTRDVAPIL